MAGNPGRELAVSVGLDLPGREHAWMGHEDAIGDTERPRTTRVLPQVPR